MGETQRRYAVGYVAGNGRVCTFGEPGSWLEGMRQQVADCGRDDPENEYFLVYQDVTAWQRLDGETK